MNNYLIISAFVLIFIIFIVSFVNSRRRDNAKANPKEIMKRVKSHDYNKEEDEEDDEIDDEKYRPGFGLGSIIGAFIAIFIGISLIGPVREGVNQFQENCYNNITTNISGQFCGNGFINILPLVFMIGLFGIVIMIVWQAINSLRNSGLV